MNDVIVADIARIMENGSSKMPRNIVWGANVSSRSSQVVRRRFKFEDAAIENLNLLYHPKISKGDNDESHVDRLDREGKPH